MAEHVRSGRCACGAIAFKMTGDPFVVHACHCRDCRKLSGGGFIINAWIEASAVALTAGTPRVAVLKGGSGKDHELSFCGTCATQIWSNYHAAAGDTRFVRVGCLDDPAGLAVEIHIFVRSKCPDIEIPPGATAFAEFYNPKEVWAADKFARFRANMKIA